MKFYIAKMVFIISVENENRKPQYEEKLVCIKAKHSADAYTKALMMGKNWEMAFVNDNLHHMRWKFIGITHLSILDNFGEDLELFSEIREHGEVETSILIQRTDSLSRRFTEQHE